MYTPKTLQALQSVRDEDRLAMCCGSAPVKRIPVRTATGSGIAEYSGGGALMDMGCHCIEIARQFIGKDIRPLEVMCWAATQVHPIDVEDHAIGLVRYENGAIGQFEVSWCFRGGMDLRDEIAGRDGTIFLNHWLRTGFECLLGRRTDRLRRGEGGKCHRLAVPRRGRTECARLHRYVGRHAGRTGKPNDADRDVL